ncbi:hypothetical protein TRM7557_01748 [Tritonibacter multivorans]|uniref:Uncharacterized protein n=1 Tax=Tritonibacter multivorans TaxID=928856 RepID=A0A0P1GRJ6_9RHOB|nr:hypothetical protein [Tritonibacter multivorans]MDA7423074.1 hypothetical protein [Tritonibacter multivorans]CUH78157.1 hypothetical protein TRM7557_01748 [Tritonibacter multivorans]SFD82386.1 hypothetical protein SAMN04488049_1392 [Tritonibacter multivorans]
MSRTTSHKALRKFIAGKDLSRKGLERLLNAYLEHASERGVDVDDEIKRLLPELISVIFSKQPRQLPLEEARSSLKDCFPASVPPRTVETLIELQLKSITLTKDIEKEGPTALLRLIEGNTDPNWAPLFNELTLRLRGTNEVPEDLTDALQITYGLILLWVFWGENLDRHYPVSDDLFKVLEISRDTFFVDSQNEFSPQSAVTRLLSKVQDFSELDTKSAFIKEAFGASTSQVREAHKYFAGSDIPTFEKTASAMRAFEQDRDHSIPVILAQYTARSYRHLTESLSSPLSAEQTPHFIIFDQLNQELQARKSHEPAHM